MEVLRGRKISISRKILKSNLDKYQIIVVHSLQFFVYVLSNSIFELRAEFLVKPEILRHI